MTQTELLRFSRVLDQGMEKQALAAFAGKAFGNLGRAAGNGAGALGWAARGAGRAANTISRGVGRAAGATNRFLQTPIPLPNAQFARNMMQEARVGYREGAGTAAPASALQGPNPLQGPPGYLRGPKPQTIQTPQFPARPIIPPAGPPKLVPDPEAFVSGQVPEPKPQGYLARAKNLWSNSGTAGRAGMAYGGVTAATAPSNYVANRKADWQNAHPIMSWAGRTFAGMPNYTSHNYLMPSFLQS